MRIFISNIDYQASEADLLKILTESGLEPKSIQIIRDKETGKSRGFGFAKLGSDQEGQLAIGALDGVCLNARKLNAKPARDGTAPRKAQLAATHR